MEPQTAHGRLADMDPKVIHDLFKLRGDTFVVEQQCAYDDLDGNDALDTTEHWWVTDGERVVAGLRLLDRGDHRELGRMVAHPDVRGGPIARDLVQAALASAVPPIRINAQTGLEPWYLQFGFTRNGDPFVLDGISHVPMVRTAGATADE